MAFTTKQKISNQKFYQASGDTITLSGTTLVKNLEYIGTPNITGDTQIVPKIYVDNAIGNTVTGATNGLTKTGANVKLGGTLTGDTELLGGGVNDLVLGTSGSRLQSFAVRTTNGITLNDSTGGGIYLQDTDGGIGITSNNGTITIEAGDVGNANGEIYIGTIGNNGIWMRNKDVSGITRTELLMTPSVARFTDSRTGTTAVGLQYNADYSANYTNRSLVDKGYVTTVASSGITTANNGLTKTGQNVRLGGTLSQDTVVGTGGFQLDLSGTTGEIAMTIGGNHVMVDTGGVIVQLNGADTFRYAADYSANYVDRSLVDKGYVDNVAAGLDVKEASHVATTAAISGTYVPTGGIGTGSFTGVSTTVVDGYTLQNGDRILVKNQPNPIQNGIYYWVSGTTWWRAEDQNGQPASEVSPGNFTFVTSGDTLAGTGWIILGTGSTLTLNTDPINWTQFNAATLYTGGNGIVVTGGTVINVDLGTNSGLFFDGGQLEVDPNIAGSGLAFNSGVLSVNTGNGLSKVGDTVVLGGTLTGDTFVAWNGGNSYVQYETTSNSGIGFYEVYLDDTNGGYSSSVVENSGIGFDVSDGVTLLQSQINLDNLGNVTITSNNPIPNRLTSIAQNPSGITVSSNFSGFKGIQYAADYSAGFTPRSLVDKEYVDIAIVNSSLSGVTAINNTWYGIGAGNGATTDNTTHLGYQAGFNASNAIEVTFVGSGAGNNATNAYSSTFLGYSAGNGATDAYNSTFLGYSAGNSATNAYNSTFLGFNSGVNATNADSSTFLGNNVGYNATNADNSTFLGNNAGYNATNAYSSTFLGNNAGNSATDANSSTFIGFSAGNSATNADNSTFLGVYAGNAATNAAYSIFIGYNAGSNDTIDSTLNDGNSILIGNNLNSGGYKNSMILGNLSGNTIVSNTMDNQFLIPSSYLNWQIRGIDYVMPSTQGNLNSLLLNDGNGSLSWVDVDISNVTGGTNASNGLSIGTGGEVVLGGTLTGNTDIVIGANNSLSFQGGGYIYNTNIKQFNVLVTGDSGIQLYNNNADNDIDIFSTNSNTYITSRGTTKGIYLSAKDSGDTFRTILTLTPTDATFTDSRTGTTAVGIEYDADYSVNYTDRSLVDKAYVDNLIPFIANTSQTLTNSTKKLVLVNTSGATTITLPASPVDGKCFHIKDKSGNALTNNITIAGNGNNIDGAGSATINTDYGSLFLVYSVVEDAWFSLAFVS